MLPVLAFPHGHSNFARFYIDLSIYTVFQIVKISSYAVTNIQSHKEIGEQLLNTPPPPPENF